MARHQHLIFNTAHGRSYHGHSALWEFQAGRFLLTGAFDRGHVGGGSPSRGGRTTSPGNKEGRQNWYDRSGCDLVDWGWKSGTPTRVWEDDMEELFPRSVRSAQVRVKYIFFYPAAGLSSSCVLADLSRDTDQKYMGWLRMFASSP